MWFFSPSTIPYDYDYGDKKAESGKVSRFNGDPEEFSWWKTNLYSYVIGLDGELWDILEDGVGDLILETLKITLTMKLLIYPCSQNNQNTPESKMTIIPF